MKRIGITGQEGFVGKHLYNFISLLKDEFEIIPFKKELFNDTSGLEVWAKRCDTIVHLAALNRHEDPEFLHHTNISLVNKLISTLEISDNEPHIIFSSSTQEDNDSQYGTSKRKGRDMFNEWSKKTGGRFTGLVIPNVYGPFCKPFYNSVVATFCHQLCIGDKPVIDQDKSIDLIYIDDLITCIVESIRSGIGKPAVNVQATDNTTVSGILKKLTTFKNDYLEKGVFPFLPDAFSTNLFNTFRSHIDLKKHFPFRLTSNSDDRGMFVELIRSNISGQVSFSTTKPGIVRGNHFHTRKIERFMVIKGTAEIAMRKYNTEDVIRFEVNGSEPSFVDMPVWYIHNIRNVGMDELYTVFWINEHFNPNNADTYFQEV